MNYTVTQQDETVDALCHRVGLGSGHVEEVYTLNRGLATLGPVLPMGIVVYLPANVGPKRIETALINLWD